MRHRADTTQAAIVRALRDVGWRVWVIGGAIDLAVLVGSDVYLVDAKTAANSPLTLNQQAMVAGGWPIIFGTDGQGVVDAIMARRAR